MSRVDVVTFGCRLNAVESEAVRRAAEAAGHKDTIVFNTCAVTQEAVKQARQAIRRASRERPGARIVVTLLGALKKTGGKRGVASLCIGGGEATALAVEMC